MKLKQIQRKAENAMKFSLVNREKHHRNRSKHSSIEPTSGNDTN